MNESPTANLDILFDDAVIIATLASRADADIAAGRVIDHDAVLNWLRSWGRESPRRPVS